jgi:hypothetical protein
MLLSCVYGSKGDDTCTRDEVCGWNVQIIACALVSMAERGVGAVRRGIANQRIGK